MKFIYAILLTLILSMGVNAAKVDKTGFFFVQIADTQLGFSTRSNDLTPDIEHFQKAVEHVNRLKPAFVIISGDLVNAAHDPAQIRAFWRVAKQIRADVPLYLVAGNHDLPSSTESDIKSYNKLFGKDYYSFSFQGSTFVVLNSPLICSSTGDVSAKKAQRAWFEEQLASAKQGNPNHIFVFTHHPWFMSNPEEKDDYWTIPGVDRQDYLSLMDRYGVDFAVTGHRHQEVLAHAKNLTMVTTTGLSVAFGPDTVGFKIFKVYKDHVDFKFYPLDQVPEKVGL